MISFDEADEGFLTVVELGIDGAAGFADAGADGDAVVVVGCHYNKGFLGEAKGV